MWAILRPLVLLVLVLMLAVRADPVAQAVAYPRAEAPKKRIALTFDDIPRAPGAFLAPDARAAKLLAVLRDRNVEQAAFFVNPARVNIGDGDEARIGRYAAAGHVLANHSFTHPRLGSTSADTYLADIDKAEAWLKPRPGYRAWFRYPFLDEGGRDKAKRDAIRSGLESRGLLNAYVTVDGSDWHMEQQAVAAKKAGKTIDMAAFRDLYVETHVQSADFADALAVRTLGRSPPHVLLLHETDIAALWLGELIDGLRKDGWEIVTADAAFADPIYRAKPETPVASGTLVEGLAWEKQITGPRWYERNNTDVAAKLFSQRVLHE
jgi:peptidoglycan/xylan/chitin deacetylase (PgdA/CDA1 family)